jgi:hypothetical protein
LRFENVISIQNFGTSAFFSTSFSLSAFYLIEGEILITPGSITDSTFTEFSGLTISSCICLIFSNFFPIVLKL